MRKFVVCFFLLATLPACVGNAGTTTVIAPLVPYQTFTPFKTPTVIPLLTQINLPTPTIFTYTVVQGDTLIGIAGRFGITLEALLVANPGIQAAALTIGKTLTIPAGNDNLIAPTPSPAPLQVKQTQCWKETDGGLWCFALLQNDYNEPVESLSAQITLFGTSGQNLAAQVVFGLLNTLPPGQTMPLAAHFAPPIAAGGSVRVQVLTAIRLLPGDSRYLPVMLENTLLRVQASGRTAQVSGRVILTAAGTANKLWVLATAYDKTGNVVGLRRWESSSPLSAGTPTSFDLMISSVGPGIDHVKFLAEAMP
jgi:hypothetical protein